jgi:Rieske Fe-S protein
MVMILAARHDAFAHHGSTREGSTMARTDPVKPGTVEPLDRPIERRRFIKALLGISLLSTLSMVAAPVIGFLFPPRTAQVGAGGRLLVGKADAIALGHSKVVALSGKPVIVLNSPQGLKAFSAVCTHLGCIVGYDASKSSDIVSPCHDGHFNAVNGTVVSGPPPAPLKEYRVAVEKDQIYVQDG